MIDITASRPRPRFVYKAAGAPCDHWPEHLKLNPGSFATSATSTSDDWLYEAQYSMSPARVQAGQTRTTDQTAYSTQPIEQSWQARMQGTLSPAKVTNSSTGATRQGQLT